MIVRKLSKLGRNCNILKLYLNIFHHFLFFKSNFDQVLSKEFIISRG